MGTENIDLRYEGPALAAHRMDVADLAPAIMSFGDLFKEANRVINSDRAFVNVYMHADIHAKCVSVSFDVIVSLYEQARSLLQDEHIATAKQLLEWLGIIGGGGGLFWYLRHKKAGAVTQRQLITNTDGDNTIRLTIEGNDNVIAIAPQVELLANDARVVRAAQGVVRPVAQRDGVEKVTFERDDNEELEIDKEYAVDVTAASVYRSDDDEPTSDIVGHIRVYAPVLDTKAKHWKFTYDGRPEMIDISESSISNDIMRRGKVVIGDTWKVRMQITEKRTAGGGFKNEYKVMEVLGFTSGDEQTTMPLEG